MIDLDKFICDFLSFKLSKEQKNQILFRGSYYQANAALKYIRYSLDYALKQQGFEYKEGSIKPIKEPVNFEEFTREEQLKWYICIKPIPQKDGGFMPLFCEGEHATIEKIFDMLPELKNDTALFTEHFRKVTEVELPKEKPSIKENKWIPQSGDRIRKKGTASPIYVLCSKTDIGFRFVEERKVGIAGGELSCWDLKENYELVERPKTIEEALDELFKPLMSHIKENKQKPSTIKFDEPDIEEMVEERFKDMAWCYAFGEREFAKREYRKGLEDMWNKLKKNEK